MLASVLVGWLTMVGRLILACGISCVVVIFGMPHLEEGREQARNAHAFILARQIQSGELPADTVDPWGNGFDITRTADNEMIVVSRGANMVTPPTGYDSDDVSTSMSNPPHRKAMPRQQSQLVCALGLAAAPWLVILLSAIGQRTGETEP
jgi:hypothetical protein